jgi:glycosyltransferase involved in cell wall biosynthesis
MIKTSLIISTYNWPEALELCLKSILGMIMLPTEVIIADDGSDDVTRLLIDEFEKLFPVPLIHIWQPDEGFRKTLILNKAVKVAQSDYIIQIDGDVILDKHFVYDHVVNAEAGVFIRGTRAMLTKDKTEQVLKTKSTSLSPFHGGISNRNNALRIPLFKWLATRKEMSSEKVRGSNLSYFKKDFIQVNGYNNNLTGWGHEDEELAARFINSGIMKKILKLAAVQYHLFHSISEKDKEPAHAREVNKVLTQKLTFCTYGFDSLDND